MPYWRIRWNAGEPGARRANRSFETFPVGVPFETFGYNATPGLFAEVEDRDIVFCYQTDEGRYTAVCEVVQVEPNNDIGGRCLVLRKLNLLVNLQQRCAQMTALGRLSEQEAQALCEAGGLHWPIEIGI